MAAAESTREDNHAAYRGIPPERETEPAQKAAEVFRCWGLTNPGRNREDKDVGLAKQGLVGGLKEKKNLGSSSPLAGGELRLVGGFDR